MAPLADELSWEVDVSGTSVLLNVLGSIGVAGNFDGDFDVDFDVDGADFIALRRGFGDSTDADDFAAWEANFGTTPPAATAITKPGAPTLTLLADC